jgi:Na+/H+-dicarboxylate symporter
VQLLGMAAPVNVSAGTVWIADSPEQILIQINTAADPPGQYITRRVVVRGPTDAPPENWPDPPPQVDPQAEIMRIEAPTVGELEKRDPEAYALLQLHGRSTARRVGDFAQTAGNLFLQMLKMVSIPLIITSLLTGVTGLGHAERLGKMFGRTILYYLCTSMIAICIGLLMVNLIRPGERNQAAAPPRPAAADGAQPGAEGEPVKQQKEGKSLPAVLFEQLQNIFPPNPIAAAAEGNFLSIIAFSLAFGIFTILAGGQTADFVRQASEAAFEVMMKMTMAIIHLAPLGVLLLMLAATASQGLAIFGSLGLYMITVACALFAHAVIVLPLILKFVARRDPWDFAKAMSPALLTAFSSASSNGTLPLTMTSAEQRGGVSNRVCSFVLPLGATINMDGTALYEVVAVLFIAQFTGHDLSLAQQIIVAFTALLASIGAAGIPHAGLVMMVIILQAVGLETETQGLIIAVDRVLDMCRTSVNVWSDSCGCTVVARFEAE